MGEKSAATSIRHRPSTRRRRGEFSVLNQQAPPDSHRPVRRERGSQGASPQPALKPAPLPAAAGAQFELEENSPATPAGGIGPESRRLLGAGLPTGARSGGLPARATRRQRRRRRKRPPENGGRRLRIKSIAPASRIFTLFRSSWAFDDDGRLAVTAIMRVKIKPPARRRSFCWPAERPVEGRDLSRMPSYLRLRTNLRISVASPESRA